MLKLKKIQNKKCKIENIILIIDKSFKITVLNFLQNFQLNKFEEKMLYVFFVL